MQQQLTPEYWFHHKAKLTWRLLSLKIITMNMYMLSTEDICVFWKYYEDKCYLNKQNGLTRLYCQIVDSMIIFKMSIDVKSERLILFQLIGSCINQGNEFLWIRKFELVR